MSGQGCCRAQIGNGCPKCSWVKEYVTWRNQHLGTFNQVRQRCCHLHHSELLDDHCCNQIECEACKQYQSSCCCKHHFKKMKEQQEKESKSQAGCSIL